MLMTGDAAAAARYAPDSCSDIAVVILTFNEEENLSACIESVAGWAREIFVVDSYSTDCTVDIALSYADRGVRIVQHAFVDYAKQWNWALTKLPISATWTLKLDADERATSEFREEVSMLLASCGSDLQGCYFRRRFYFMRKPLTYSGRIGYDLRMWRTGAAQFEDRSVNEHALVQGKVAYLKSFVDHRDMKPVSDWIDKHNRYSSLEADNALRGNLFGGLEPRFWGAPEERRMWLRRAYHRMPFAAAAYFLYLYVFCLAVLDGAAGFRYSLLRAQFLFWMDLKIREHRELGTLPVVVWPERGTPHEQVRDSELQRMVDGS